MSVTWLLQGAGPPGGVGAGSDGGEARDNMCLDMVQTRAGGQEGLKLRSGSFSRSARQAAEPTDSTPNVVTCHVTVISWLGRERHAPFLIRNREKRRHHFLMPRFLNAREQLYTTAFGDPTLRADRARTVPL